MMRPLSRGAVMSLSRYAVRMRVNRGWSEERALSEPVMLIIHSPRCTALTATKKPCPNPAKRGHDYCPKHLKP